jgi:hypothetical protein
MFISDYGANMADKHPYTTSPSYILQTLDQLRKVFPENVDADTLKKYGLAQSNEGTVINILRHLNLIDETNSRTKDAQAIFSERELGEFQEKFAEVVKSAYSKLFDLHGEDAWSLSLDKLITFFRKTDFTSERLGKEQARTFQTLGSYAGKASNLPVPLVKQIAPRPSKKPVLPPKSAKKSSVASGIAPSVASPTPVAENNQEASSTGKNLSEVALTVRIEINLPVATDQETYDRIFKSIRENLMNGQ